VKKVFLFIVTIFLIARDNPFMPTVKTKIITNNHAKIPDFFEETKISLPNSARMIRKITITYQKFDGSIDKISKKVNSRADWHYPLILSHNRINTKKDPTKLRQLKLKNIDFVKMQVSQKVFLLQTDDKKIRDFMLNDPYRIVIDFKSNKTFYTKSTKIKNSYFKKVTIGNHDKYYRLVLYLDGYYDYKVTKKITGFLITLQ